MAPKGGLGQDKKRKSWVYEEDIGKMCAFLISEDALRISGQIIGVNGNEIRLD